MKLIEKFMEYDADFWRELIADFTDDEIESMNMNYCREEFCNDFWYRVYVVRDCVHVALVLMMGTAANLEWQKKLFDFYYQLEHFLQECA